jgi:hypothetical protein
MCGCCPFASVSQATEALILIEQVEDSPPTAASTKEH